MAIGDLITSSRALYNLNNLDTTTGEDTTVAALISGVSNAIKNYCRRDFTETTYDQVYDGTNRAELILDQYPITEMIRVAYAPTQVLEIQNTSSSVQRAYVKVRSTGLKLLHYASGVETESSEIPWTTYPTIGDVATQITAEGAGWSASAVPQFQDHGSDGLQFFPGSYAAKTAVGLKLHTEDLDDYEASYSKGILTQAQSSRFDELDTGGIWAAASRYWRVTYKAGYTTVPEDLQEACAQWVAWLFWQTKRDPGLTQESIVGVVQRTPHQRMPKRIKEMLDEFKDTRIARTAV
ncbi:MAG: hypothetical protein ACFCD0_23890 [Gemmataceae bacterium]